MNAAPQVFLSYSREDQATARRFAEAFAREGFNVWWDQSLRTGEAYDHVTEQALRGARAVVVLWSKTSVVSRWVRAEATIADRQKTLMPAMIEPCDRPVMFELTQTAELAHWKGDAQDAAWRAFIADLRRIALHEGESAPRQDAFASPASALAPRPARSARGLWAAVGLAVAAVAAGTGWLWQRSAAVHRARTELVPQISRLVDSGDFPGAFALAQEARRYVPDDPMLMSLTPLFVARYVVTSVPEGVEVQVRRYDAVDEPWLDLGKTPLPAVELPRTALRWRFEKPGFATAERANSTLGFQDGVVSLQQLEDGELRVDLKPEAEQPEDMVYVPSGPAVPAGDIRPLAEVPAFFMQRTEVTNAQYREFVAAGGYERRSYWGELDADSGRGRPSFEDSLKRFVDSTGRAGPATWELGSYPEGQADYPVTGISWYEAAAYAQFRGRSLPTYMHWLRAALPPDELPASLGASIAPLSNFGTNQPAPAGRYQGVGLYGTYDVFGNAREWLFNRGKSGGWLVGGSWEDPTYQFTSTSAAALLDRSGTNGFRTILVSGESRDLAALWAPVDLTINTASAESIRPVSDEVYADYVRQLAYQPGMLNATEPQILATTEDWIKQRVIIDTGYNRERMAVVLFVPRRATPPFQPVIYISGAQTVSFPDRSENIEPGMAGFPIDYIVKSGRLLVQPVLQGTYERFTSVYDPSDRVRMLREWIERRADLGRTIDYLATRSDVASDKIGYLGLSFGASAALPLVAVERRLKAAVLVSGGLPPPGGPYTTDIPLMDVPSHVKRISIPVLMINGNYDNTFPRETAQVPIFNLLATPLADKKHVNLEYGHGSPPRARTLSEILGWYDKYLGPVSR